jgi:hypothetical protein
VVLYLDLDVVIMDALDPFFAEEGAFPLIRDWYHPVRLVGNSSVYRYRPADRWALFDDFRQHTDDIVTRIRNEQEYLSEYLEKRGELSFWPAQWCQSFRVGCLAPWPVRLWEKPKAPPGTRILIFHGSPKPDEAMKDRNGLWLQSWRASPWLAQYWRE